MQVLDRMGRGAGGEGNAGPDEVPCAQDCGCRKQSTLGQGFPHATDMLEEQGPLFLCSSSMSVHSTVFLVLPEFQTLFWAEAEELPLLLIFKPIVTKDCSPWNWAPILGMVRSPHALSFQDEGGWGGEDSASYGDHPSRIAHHCPNFKTKSLSSQETPLPSVLGKHGHLISLAQGAGLALPLTSFWCLFCWRRARNSRLVSSRVEDILCFLDLVCVGGGDQGGVLEY